MQLSRCPICHSRIHLDALIQDEAGRELLGIVTRLPDRLRMALVTYLGLFRPATRDLANDRALRLGNETLALCEDQARLATALQETVQSMRKKQDEGTFKPLSNHRYLLSVLDTVASQSVGTAVVAKAAGTTATNQPASKTAQGIELLRTYPAPADVPEWFTRTVCGCLAELMIMGLEGVPAYDTLGMVAERWLHGLWPKREWQQHCRFRGAKRLHDAIVQAAEHSKRWPNMKDVLDMVPKV